MKTGDKQSRLHGLISRKIVHFIPIGVRTSNPKKVPWIDSRHISPELLLYLFIFHFQSFSHSAHVNVDTDNRQQRERALLVDGNATVDKDVAAAAAPPPQTNPSRVLGIGSKTKNIYAFLGHMSSKLTV
jgi:hypothetical protein